MRARVIIAHLLLGGIYQLCSGLMNFPLGMWNGMSSTVAVPFGGVPALGVVLLNHFFQLRAQDSPVVAIKRDMEPVTFFALDYGFVGLSMLLASAAYLAVSRDHR